MANKETAVTTMKTTATQNLKLTKYEAGLNFRADWANFFKSNDNLVCMCTFPGYSILASDKSF